MENRYQLCVIKNGELRHYYYSPERNRAWMSVNRATMMSKARAMEIMLCYTRMRPEMEIFIQSEYDCHFREVDEDNNIINPHTTETEFTQTLLLYTLFSQYLQCKSEQCMHIDDWKALERVKEIMINDFPSISLI